MLDQAAHIPQTASDDWVEGWAIFVTDGQRLHLNASARSILDQAEDYRAPLGVLLALYESLAGKPAARIGTTGRSWAS